MSRLRAQDTIVWLAVVLASSVGAAAASAQTTSSSIQGTVTDETGVLPGASVVAKETASGFTYEAVTDANGLFALSGLRPGTYEITVTMASFKPAAKSVQLPVGQNITLDFRITSDLVYTEQVQVVGSTNRLVETKTAEISTNVSQEQVRYLPQNQRNFLNFAALAPGVKMSQDETRKELSAGGLEGSTVNVFIDGVSYKNDVLQGGVVGQDASRGSPFPQAAVQEFQVLTQNYKAEHEKASSAVITAVTRSGTNRWSGDAFLLFQNKDFVALDEYSEGRALEKPSYERYQPGGSLGGPIVRDKVLVFGAYEENRQNRESQVFLGGTPFPPSLDLQRYEGTFPSEFRERLLFTKATYQPSAGQLVDVSYSLRTETDVRGFGAQTSFESAEDVQNRVDSVLGRWQVPGGNWLNEMTLTYQRFNWNPQPLDPDQIGIEYEGVIRTGGRDTTQDFVQQRTSLRNDFTRFMTWNGTHTLKGGAVLSFLQYDVMKLLNGNPVFRFRSDTNFAYPSTANYGFGNPDLSTDNKQLGFFAQDDWAITGRLTLNLGLRWDYETDMINNDYVTPDTVRAYALQFGVEPAQYFTDGDDREAFSTAWQPRVGISYDLTGDGRHVLFGGYGRYYDRVVYNNGLDEKFRQQYQVLTFRFSETGLPDPDGNPTIVWRPEYLSKAALDALVAQGVAPRPEAFLIENDTRPPVADQFNAGIRTSVAGILLTANYAGIRGRNGMTFVFGTRRPDGECCIQLPDSGFSNLLLSKDERKNWFDALYVTADRPYDGKWGMSLAYTLGTAEANGGDLFTLDWVSVDASPRRPAATDERNRLVATGIFGLPYDLIGSAVLTLGSGFGYTISDFSRGFGISQRQITLYGGRPDHDLAYRSLDLRLEKAFRFLETHRASVAIEAFNVFNYTNDACFEGFIPPAPEVNPRFGMPSCVVDNSTRRLQVGLRYTF